MMLRAYTNNVWAMTGGVSPNGFRPEFSIVADRGDLDAPSYIPAGCSVGFNDKTDGSRITVPTFAFRGF